LRHERLPPSRWESSRVSHRPGAPVQLDPLSAPGLERRQMWSGRGGRSRPDIGLDAQPADPYVRWLSTSGDRRYHVIRWGLPWASTLNGGITLAYCPGKVQLCNTTIQRNPERGPRDDRLGTARGAP